ncbi:MAG: DUF4013 domain-containing protein [Candidatus Xenobia bacterium]
MTCTSCEQSNPENARFCARCGAPLPVPVGVGARSESSPSPQTPMVEETTPGLGSLSTIDAMMQPLKDPQFGPRIGTAALLGLLGIVPLLGQIVVSFLVMGFSVLYLGSMLATRHFTRLPEWAQWDRLGVQGAKAWLISVIWMLPSLALFLVGAWKVAGPLFQVIVHGGAGQNFMSILQGALGLIGAAAVIGVLLMACVPIGILFFVERDDVARAFALGDIVGFLTAHTGDYLIYLAVTIGISLVSAVAMTVLTAIPVLGLVLTLPVNAAVTFAVGLMTQAALANLWARGR